MTISGISHCAVLGAVSATPLVALPVASQTLAARPKQTEVARFYGKWHSVMNEYVAVVAADDAGQLSDDQFMAIADPLLDPRLKAHQHERLWFRLDDNSVAGQWQQLHITGISLSRRIGT